MENGDLLNAAEAQGFDLMVTCDRNLRYQQNLSMRRIAIVEITINRWSLIQPEIDRIVLAIQQAKQGDYQVVEIPWSSE